MQKWERTNTLCRSQISANCWSNRLKKMFIKATIAGACQILFTKTQELRIPAQRKNDIEVRKKLEKLQRFLYCLLLQLISIRIGTLEASLLYKFTSKLI